MPIWFSKVWNDPVGAGLIATAIVALISTIWASIHFGWWKRFASSVSQAWRQSQQFSPKISLVQVNATEPDRAGLTYPLKCYVELRNDSEGSIDVRMSNYRPNKVPAKLKLLNVLQLKFSNAWVPTVETDQVAALPRQLFRIWIPIDENKYTAQTVNDLRGVIGEVLFIVNGTDIDVPI
jgi:hypothetical protein